MAWRLGPQFALIRPLVGLAIAMTVLFANMAIYVPPGEWIFLFLGIPFALTGAYVVGGPAAFVVGAAKQLMCERSFKMIWIVAVNVVFGAAISTLTVVPINRYFGGHPFSDPAYGVSALGAVSALICTLLIPHHRRTESRDAASKQG